jgi:rhamnosyltransferase
MPALDVSVVIPVLNASRYIPSLIDAFRTQQPHPPLEIILADSSSTDDTCELVSDLPDVRVIPVKAFTHGSARNLAAGQAKGDVIALLSQDALPRDCRWLERLIEPFSDATVAATFSRQVPHETAKPMEKYFYFTHFPDGAPVRRVKHADRELGFQDVFFSNVSAAIRRDILLRHPFDEKVIMSEDQQFARDVLQAGYATVYQPGSEVTHSHDYSLKNVFQRYFDSCYSLTKIFEAHDTGESARIGLAYLFKEMRFMLRHHMQWLPYYFCFIWARSLGTLAGHYADRLPRRLARAFSMHRYYWD